jgi:RNA polymerase sigma-70 factor (ECF subfamily)
MQDARWPDEELVRRFREGDVVAFETLLDRYSRPIYNFAFRLLGNQDDAEDAVQQTFVQAFESLPGVKAQTPLRPWLFQVARNKCIDLIRKRRTVPLSSIQREDDEPVDIDPPDARPRPEELYERAELQEILQNAIADLPLRTREVVVMRYVAELTFAEIAAAMGIPENTAKTLFQRAKPLLRASISRRL